VWDGVRQEEHGREHARTYAGPALETARRLGLHQELAQLDELLREIDGAAGGTPDREQQ
jgi:hypothetical protein